MAMGQARPAWMAARRERPAWLPSPVRELEPNAGRGKLRAPLAPMPLATAPARTRERPGAHPWQVFPASEWLMRLCRRETREWMD